jgi:hypothetical protein
MLQHPCVKVQEDCDQSTDSSAQIDQNQMEESARGIGSEETVGAMATAATSGARFRGRVVVAIRVAVRKALNGSDQQE